MAAVAEGPCPPGRYPVVVVGSGPGGLQIAYSLRRLGVESAIVSSDETPGGMFQHFPIYQRLISWTKPYALAERGTREYERYDWNSLLGDEEGERALMPDHMDGSSYFPARSEMEENLKAFARATGLSIRHNCRWTSTDVTERGFSLHTTDGTYECDVAVFAMGMAEPWKPPIPGIEDVPHYVDTELPSGYEGARVALIGKRNSGFELADGLLPWAKQIVMISPSPAQVSIITHSLVGARARYLQPYEDHVLAGGNVIVDAALDRIERTGEGFRIRAQGTTIPGPVTFDVDRVIAATGFQVPMQDLRDLGVATFVQDRLPAQTPFWESVSVPGIYFAGTVSQGATELRKYGIPSSSAAVHGFRYNARILARHIAESHFGIAITRPQVPPDELASYLLAEATGAPELWNQKSYLARVLLVTEGGIVDDGIGPLSHFVDSEEPPGVAITLEVDDHGDLHPVMYVRAAGKVDEYRLPSTPGHDYRTSEHRALVVDRLAALEVSA